MKAIRSAEGTEFMTVINISKIFASSLLYAIIYDVE
jgi:hypothetical protein